MERSVTRAIGQLVAGMFEKQERGGSPRSGPDDPIEVVRLSTTGRGRTGRCVVTWQATPRNKVNVWWDEQTVCQHCVAGGSLTGLVFAGGIQLPESAWPYRGLPGANGPGHMVFARLESAVA